LLSHPATNGEEKLDFPQNRHGALIPGQLVFPLAICKL
jgi:hypothetical protein